MANSKPPPVVAPRHRANVVYGNTTLKDRERDGCGGHLLPMHPHDRRKGR